MRNPEPIAAAVIDEAITWAVRLHHGEADAGSRERFAQWCAAAPAHAQAWQRLEALRGDFAALPAQASLQVLGAASGHDHSRRRALRLLSGAGLAGAGLWLLRDLPAVQDLRADHATAVGEHRPLQLDDGTRLILNTDSAVDVRFDARQRLLLLQRGELAVETGADADSPAHRPLLVEDRHGRYRALGTRFVVRLDEHATQISVGAGRVEVQAARGGASAQLAPGESLRLDARGTLQADAQALDPLAWLDGVIVARQLPLRRFVAELARYRRGWLSCDDAIADLPVSGVFQTADTGRTLEFLTRSLSLRVEQRSRFWTRLQRA